MTATAQDTSAYDALASNTFLYGTMSVALAMAQETGIISLLCQATEPLSSSDVAEQGKLKERYVRELLNGLAVGGLVQLEEGTGTKDCPRARYHVPQHNRKTLTSTAFACRLVSAAGRKFPDIKDCFDRDGPSCARYIDYEFSIMDDLRTSSVDNIVAGLLKTPGLKQLFESGAEVMELGCGKGALCRCLAAMFPRTSFTVTDVVPEPLQVARQLAQDQGLTNMTFKQADIFQVPDELEGKFDWVLTLDVVHDLPHPLEALKGVFKLLKPEGHYSMVDQFVSSYVAVNKAQDKSTAMLYALGTFMCIPESFQQADSEALGPCWGEEKARELLALAGFDVLGLTRSGTESMGHMAVCMCQKPKQ